MMHVLVVKPLSNSMSSSGSINICIMISLLINVLISLDEVASQIIPSFTIVEELPIGTELKDLTDYLMRQTDDKPGDISIFETEHLITKILMVDTKTNQKIIIGKRLDREELCWEKNDVSCEFDIPFIFSSTDILVTVRLKILDINDNPPSFPRATDIVTIWEYPKDTGWTGDVRLDIFMHNRRVLKKKIVVSPAQDPDFGNNGKFKYSLEVDKSYKTKKGKPLFELDQSSVNVTAGNQLVTIVTTGEVDKEEHSDYTLVLSATDLGKPNQLTGSVTILVLIQDLNEYQPKFTKSLFTNFNLSETAPIGTLVLKLEATDQDPGENGVIRYDFTDKNYTNALDWFTLSLTGELRVKERLDYDRSSSLRNFNFKVIAIDNSIAKFEKTGTATVSIRIRDENDERPNILLMKKKRQPPNDRFSLTDEDRDRYMSPNKLDQIIWENDYRPNYVLSYLRVSDLDYNSTDSVICMINTTSTYRLNKKQVDYWQKRISLKKMQHNYYSLVVNQPPFDREIVKDFDVTVQCKDTGNNVNKTTFNFFVLDDNDNEPVFDKRLYKFTVTENKTNPQKIGHVLARDADSGRNAKISYRLEGYGAELFHIDDRGALKTQKIVDRERDEHFMLSLLAIDNAIPGRTLTGTSTVSVSVKDVNDWAPEFENAKYQFSVIENQPMNTIVGRVHAYDNDLISSYNNPNTHRQKLKYSLVSLNNPRVLMRQFRINSSGQILTNFRLDREKRSNYSMYAIVTDALYLSKIHRRHSASTMVFISILDENDNAPFFTTKNFTIFKVSMRSGPGSFIGQIKASDRDDSSNGNGRVKYRLQSCRKSYTDNHGGRIQTNGNPDKSIKLFHLEAMTGRLQVRNYNHRKSKQYYNALLREHNSYQLTIVICDFGEPELCSKSPLIAIVTVTKRPIISMLSSPPVRRPNGNYKANNASGSDGYMYLIIIFLLIILLLIIIVLMLCILLRKYNPRLFRQFRDVSSKHYRKHRKIPGNRKDGCQGNLIDICNDPNVTMDTRLDKTTSSIGRGFQGQAFLPPNQNDVFQNSINSLGSVFLPCQPGAQPPGGINVASAVQNPLQSSYPSASTPYYQQVITPPLHHTMRISRTLDNTHDRFATFSPPPKQPIRHTQSNNIFSPRNSAFQPVFFPSSTATSATMHRYYYPSTPLHDQPNITAGHYSLQRPAYKRSQSAHRRSAYPSQQDTHFTPDNYTNISSSGNNNNNQRLISASVRSNDSNKLSNSALELYPSGGHTMPHNNAPRNDSLTYYQSLQKRNRQPEESFV